MKKIVIAIILMLIISSNVHTNNFTLLDFFDGQYTSYTEQKVDNLSIDLGFCYMNDKVVNPDQLMGESIVCYDLEIGSALDKLDAAVIKTEHLDNGTTVIYCYTDHIKTNVKLNNLKINLQIATKDDKTIIGWPVIYGSF